MAAIDLNKYGINPSNQDALDFSKYGIASPNQSTSSDPDTLGVTPYMPQPRQPTISDFSNITGINRTPINQIQDFGAGILSNLGRGGNAAASILTDGYAPKVDWNQVQNSLSSPNKSMGGNVLQGMGGVLPYTLAGGALGASLGSSLGSGVGGVLEDPNHPFKSFALNALPIGTLAKMTGIFSKPIQEATQEFVHPDTIAQNVHGNIIGNRTAQESGQQLASEIKNNYTDIKAQRQGDYDKVFNKPTDEINNATGENVKAKDLGLIDNKYYSTYGDQEFPDKNIQALHNNFMDNPTIDTAHKLQSEIGSEVGYLKKQKSAGILDDAGKNKLNDYAVMRKTILDDVHDRLKLADPNLADGYANATQNWAKDVIPYHSDKTLRKIAEGQIENPKRSEIKSIFAYPESNINKVASDLSQEGRHRVASAGMNVNRFQRSAKDMTRGQNNLESSGMNSYLSPEHEQNLSVMRNNVGLQESKEAAEKEAIKNALPPKTSIPSKLWSGTKYLGGLGTLLGTNALINKYTGFNSDKLLTALLEKNAISGNQNK